MLMLSFAEFKGEDASRPKKRYRVAHNALKDRYSERSAVKCLARFVNKKMRQAILQTARRNVRRIANDHIHLACQDLPVHRFEQITLKYLNTPVKTQSRDVPARKINCFISKIRSQHPRVGYRTSNRKAEISRSATHVDDKWASWFLRQEVNRSKAKQFGLFARHEDAWCNLEFHTKEIGVASPNLWEYLMQILLSASFVALFLSCVVSGRAISIDAAG